VVGVVGSRIAHTRAVRAALRGAGATRAEVSHALAQARAHPDYFEPVFSVSPSRFAQLRAAPGPGNVYRVRGTEFQRTAGQAAITAQLGAHVIGSLGPVTAEQLHRPGAPYDATAIVGQTGLEASQERALACTRPPASTSATPPKPDQAPGHIPGIPARPCARA
jgi:hypothetical protein